jgi:hypothetical protein
MVVVILAINAPLSCEPFRMQTVLMKASPHLVNNSTDECIQKPSTSIDPSDQKSPIADTFAILNSDSKNKKQENIEETGLRRRQQHSNDMQLVVRKRYTKK